MDGRRPVVLFEPGIEEAPFEAEGAAEPGDGRVGEELRREWPPHLAHLQREKIHQAARAVLTLLFGDEQLASHVLLRDVVLGIEGPFPYVERPVRVEHGRSGQHRGIRRGTGSTCPTGVIIAG